jgi:hypothetical protein
MRTLEIAFLIVVVISDRRGVRIHKKFPTRNQPKRLSCEP